MSGNAQIPVGNTTKNIDRTGKHVVRGGEGDISPQKTRTRIEEAKGSVDIPIERFQGNIPTKIETDSTDVPSHNVVGGEQMNFAQISRSIQSPKGGVDRSIERF